MKAYNFQNESKDYPTAKEFIKDYELDDYWQKTDAGQVDITEEDRVFLFEFLHYEQHDADVQVAVLKDDLSGEDISDIRKLMTS